MTRVTSRLHSKNAQRMADVDDDDEDQADTSNQERPSKSRTLPDAAPIVYVDVFDPLEIASGRVIAFDVETTGFARYDGIVEIGAVELIDGVRTGP